MLGSMVRRGAKRACDVLGPAEVIDVARPSFATMNCALCLPRTRCYSAEREKPGTAAREVRRPKEEPEMLSTAGKT
jgi:hypothetical protein